MKIQNFDKLATSDARRSILAVAEAGLEAIDTRAVIGMMMRLEGNTLRLGTGAEEQRFDLSTIRKLIFIAVGKCAADAASVAEDVLGERITAGVVVDVRVCAPSKTGKLKMFCGTHPLPSIENRIAALAVMNTITGLAENDLVIFVVSGGGSTLLFLPQDPASREETKLFEMLTDAGATIGEINTVRRHTSYARGGYLAKNAWPARVVSFIVSDVPGDDLASVASGPTVKDTSTMHDAAAVLAKFDIVKFCPLEDCGLIETPKEDKYFEKVTNILAVSNVKALEAMKAAGEKSGFTAEIRDTKLTGNAEAVAAMVAQEIGAAAPKTLLLWGGETTVAVRNPKGSGGRNLQFTLAALPAIKGDEVILSLASDGRDHGPYAGALADAITAKAITDAGQSAEKALAEDDSYPLFEKIGNYVMTGDTGSNVSDLIIALKN